MNRDTNILIITYWGFNSGILHSYALPYVRLIRKINKDRKIFLFTLTSAKDFDDDKFKVLKEELSKEGISLVNHVYSPFGFTMVLRFIYIFYSLLKLIIQQRIKFIHAWCTPGGAIGYILSVLSGRTLILDSFEPHAETMVETGTWRKNSLAFKILFKLEYLQLRRAKHVICASEKMPAYSQITYGIKKPGYFVKPACVDLTLFTQSTPDFTAIKGLSESDIICVYAGKFGDIYLKEEVFDFFKIAADYWAGRFKVLLLTNHSEQEVEKLCIGAGIDPSLVIRRFVHHTEVPKYMSLGTFGICPVRPVPTKQYCAPIKNGEYWAMGLPVVITKNISVDSDIIEQNNIGYVLQDLTTAEYRKAVEKIDTLKAASMLKEKIRTIAERERNYSIAERIYRAIY